jgi:hypothetical protein
MKTLKLALVATIVAFAMATFANADGYQPKPQPIKVICLTLEKAMTIPGLATAMYAQIDRDEFLDGSHYTYVAQVYYNGVAYRISGTLLQWIRFFKLQDSLPYNDKEVVFRIN